MGLLSQDQLNSLSNAELLKLISDRKISPNDIYPAILSYEPLVNNSIDAPEFIFDSTGDVIMVPI